MVRYQLGNILFVDLQEGKSGSDIFGHRMWLAALMACAACADIMATAANTH